MRRWPGRRRPRRRRRWQWPRRRRWRRRRRRRFRRPRRDVRQRRGGAAQRELQEGELLCRQAELLGDDPVRPARTLPSAARDEDGLDGLRHLVVDRGGVDDDLVVRARIAPPAPHLVAQHRSDLIRWPRALPKVLLRAGGPAWASPPHSAPVASVGTEHAHHVGVQYKAAAARGEQVNYLRVYYRRRHLAVEPSAPAAEGWVGALAGRELAGREVAGWALAGRARHVSLQGIQGRS